MSIFSTGCKSFVSRKNSIAKAKKVDHFKFNKDLKELLLNFVNQKESSKVYEELVCHIRDSGFEINDKDLIKLLQQSRACISLLDRNVHLFVKVLLVQKWAHRSKELADEYEGFLLDLCSAHSYYTKLTIDQLVSRFKTDEDEPDWEAAGEPSEVDGQAYERIHSVLKTLLRVIPMSSELLAISVSKNFPYVMHGAHRHECYIYNLLRILQYHPVARRDILSLIISKMVALDTHAPRQEIEQVEMDVDNEEEVFSMEEVESLKSMKHPIAHTLDVCMDIMFRFIESETHDKNGALKWDRTKALYSDLMYIFESIVLPTFALQHVQFLFFRFINMKSTLYRSFVQFLWNKVTKPNVSPVIRQAAVSYVASLLSRATYIPLDMLKESMMNLASWIHGYIAAQDSLEKGTLNRRAHCVFYSICQALFYMVAFRHRDLVFNQKDLMFLQGLYLSKMVTCQLNPLKVCLPQVVNNFASITRTYQLAYCYTIIEHNARNSIPVVERDQSGLVTTLEEVYLDTFFPFDPYLLQRSKKYIEPLYRIYNGPSAEKVIVPQHRSREDEDDFLNDSNTSLLPSFAYGSSPGFHI